ncbi:DUF763 domain-containing protein [Candidatus Borrarchaeum sp.]|uniref:DUF763 domain-containing protein n=1 Tax=Candidatus Borrarchaeum sp. TaxID=2846742 RepID=UPI0025810F93|nr:DUF763 domain-containing protein [Candidatus Borrarchaeum sp.]
MRRTGIVNLPLHGGKAPRWLFNRMVKLAKGITLFLIEEFGGTEEFIKRISDPYWFQALSCVLGFDWHSSGTTTTTCGALKSAILPESGIAVTGGKGRFSKLTLSEIEMIGDIFSLSTQKIEELKYASKLSAKVDNNCIQDEYQLYHHSFFFTEEGDWAVVQQGLNSSNRYARRYHWSSGIIVSFVNEPHTGIACDKVEKRVLDLTAKQSSETRQISLDLIKDNPKHLQKYLHSSDQRRITDYSNAVETYTMPSRHPILLPIDLNRKDWEVLQTAYNIQPKNYEELVAIKGMGAKKIRALALISDLIFGTKASWKDPVKYSFAHGGKDGYPFPVDKEVYDNSIQILKDAVDNLASNKEKYSAVKRLESFLR